MKTRLHAAAIALLLLGVCSAFSQQPPASPTPVNDDVVKVTTNLVQLDVVVTDKDGKTVTGLQPEDFTVFQDGKQQTISTLTYVDAGSGSSERITVNGKKREKGIPEPPSNTRSKSGRIITFVVDDGNCYATNESLMFLRDSMRKFVDERMLPDDRVAIYRTQSGSSLMRVYTSNKEVLRKQISKIGPLVVHACSSAFDALRDTSTLKATGQGAESFESAADKLVKGEFNDRQREIQVAGTIGVMNFVVDRLKGIQQRKIVFLLSEGIMTRLDSSVRDSLRDLTDKAARASVVINTVSAKGLTVPGMLTAQDEVLPGIVGGVDNTGPASQARIDEEAALNEGIAYLAYSTGGIAVTNSNDLSKSMMRVLDRQTAFYLIGYEPSDETFKGKGYHQIDIRVARPDVRVSFRKGFYGRTDKDTQIVYRTPDGPMYVAMASPFEENGLDIRMTNLVGRDAAGSYVQTLFHVPGGDLTFTTEPNGDIKAVLDVVTVIFDDKGKIVEEFNRTYPITIPERGATLVQANGLDFSADIPIKKGGLYTFRLAVRDNNSKRIGTTGDYIEVPEATSKKFLVTGLSVAEMLAGSPVRPRSRPADAAFAPVLTLGVPSVRKFKQGASLPFGFVVNNARIGSTTHSPQLTKEIRIYRDGALLSTIAERPLEAGVVTGSTTIKGFETLRLGGAAVGEYVLQVIVRDKIANEVSSQTMDFEVIE